RPVEQRCRGDHDLEVPERPALDAQRAGVLREGTFREQQQDVVAGMRQRASDQTTDATGSEDGVSQAGEYIQLPCDDSSARRLRGPGELRLEDRDRRPGKLDAILVDREVQAA